MAQSQVTFTSTGLVMADNPAFEPEGPEDATEATHGSYTPLDSYSNTSPIYSQVDKPPSRPSSAVVNDVQNDHQTPREAPVSYTAPALEKTSVPEKPGLPDNFKSDPQAFKYSDAKKALEVMAEVVDIVESIVADKPYAGMGKEDLLRFSQTPFWSRFRTVCTIIFWLAWAALLGAVIGLTITFPKCVPPPEKPWHETAVIYQIYVRSFFDSDGDGIGDLEGIRLKLGYLDDIGVDAIMLSSIYQSQQGDHVDHGYEVTDHKAINPEYGTEEDFRNLLEEARNWGIKVIVEFIPNYTGTEHPWFIESSQNNSVSSPYWNYYVWKECAGGAAVNNWRSVYGQSMWTENGTRTGDPLDTEQCYLHQFLDTQPDLNVRSRSVQQELESILRYWLDMGVDGFRVDKTQYLFEDADFTNEPPSGHCTGANQEGYDCYFHNYTISQDENYELVEKWRTIVDEYSTESQKVLLTDSSDNVVNSLRYYGKYGPDGANFPLNFELTRVNETCDGRCVLRLADDFLWGVPTYAPANWLTGNHDINRFGDVIPQDGPTSWCRQNAYTLLKLTMPGAAVMYYGEEIGMTNVNRTGSDPDDPAGQIEARYSRDPFRTPMQWTTDPNDAGFIANNASGSEMPWLPVGTNLHNISVEVQNDTGNEHTPFGFFKALTDIRRGSATFSAGTFQYTLLTQNIVSYYRSYEGLNRYLIAINFGPDPERVDITGSLYGLNEWGDVLLTTCAGQEQGIGSSADMTWLYLRPGDGVVLSWAYVRPDGKQQ